MFTFGHPPALAEAGDIAWGARGIDDGESFGIPPDRNCWYLRGKTLDKDASKEDKAAMIAFHRHFMSTIFDPMQEAFRKAKNNGQMRHKGSKPVVLIDNWFVKVTAKSSYGYVHVTLATKPLPDIPILREHKEEDKFENRHPYSKAQTDYLVWSCDTRPKLGSRVCITALAEKPKGTVVGWVCEFGWLRMMVMPDGDDEVINLLGGEWELVEGDEEAA
jgi:hypothetical protein